MLVLRYFRVITVQDSWYCFYQTIRLSYFISCYLVESVVWIHLGQSIGGSDFASDVFSGGPDAGDLLVHLSLNH